MGVDHPGGIEAGLKLAEICLAGLGEVSWQNSDAARVHVRTESPVAACLASQYAGWEIKLDGFAALGSGPMRAAGSREALFDTIGLREKASELVGVLESDRLPPAEIFDYLREASGVERKKIVLLVAPVTSAAGRVQVVARSVETSLHKLHELGFDVQRVKWGEGSAPLPGEIKSSLAAMGQTNDAILYGGDVTLGIEADDAALEEIGPRIPSSASEDYGLPFVELFERHNRDFYEIDPLLFSPAKVTLVSTLSGNSFTYGKLNPELLEQSFATE